MSTQKEVFDIINNLYHVKDENNIIWFYAKELCDYLEYNKKTRDVISEHIKDNSHKTNYSKLKQFLAPSEGARNIHGLKLFINEEALYILIDKSEKPNAERFKKWTRKILSQIRKGDIKIEGSDYKAPIALNKDNNPIFFDKTQCNDEESIFYDKEDETNIQLKEQAHNIDYKYFLNKNVLYMYTTSIRNVKNNKLIIKVGYSKQIAKRTEEHKARFGADFKLIALKEVNDIDDEQRFHQHLKFKYPESIYYFQVRNNNGKGIGADEFYIFEWEMLEDFVQYNIEVKEVYKNITELEYKNNLVLLDLEKERNRGTELKSRHIELQIELLKLQANK